MCAFVCVCEFNMCVPSGLSPPFFWSPADIEVQFSAARLPNESPFPGALRVAPVQCWLRRVKEDREVTEEKKGWRREGTYPFYWRLSSFPSHTLSLPDTSSAERPAGKGGSTGGAEGGWGRRARGERGRDRDMLHSGAGWDDGINAIRRITFTSAFWFQSFQPHCLHQKNEILTATKTICQ